MMNAGVESPVANALIANASRWVDHPSGFFALSPRDEHFTLAGADGFISYREQGKHLAMFGGVHAAPADREVLLDAFIAHAELRRRRIVVVQLRASQTEMIIDRSDALVGFVTYVPVWGQTPGYLHDLTRRLATAPSGAMELCNASAIERLAAEGVAYLHFGFTPFITNGSELPGANRLVAWTMRQLRKYGGFVYPAESQAQYKLKWGPDLVEPEYLAARPISVRAVIDLLALTRSR